MADHVYWFNNCVSAIEAACDLLDDGCDVCSVGERSSGDTLSKGQIARVHTLWMKTKLHHKFALTNGGRAPDFHH